VVKKMEEEDKCADCNPVVCARDKAVECEVCNRWFHTKYQGVSEEEPRSALVL
jgi:hypothetical protein